MHKCDKTIKNIKNVEKYQNVIKILLCLILLNLKTLLSIFRRNDYLKILFINLFYFINMNHIIYQKFFQLFK